MQELLHIIDEKRGRLDAFQPLPQELVRNLNEWFRVELTYNSNAIEGNTLTRQETAMIVEKGLTIEGKTLTEHLEAVNYAEAWAYVQELASKNRSELTEHDILAIHSLILQKIDPTNAGRYRTVPVRVSGSQVIMPNPLRVPDLMIEFVTWLTTENTDHPVKIAADAHYKLVTIHPFVDGNGRTARLLNDLVLQQYGYPPALVENEVRKAYISSLEKAQLSGGKDMADYYQVMFTAAAGSLDIYLDAAENKEPQLPMAPLSHVISDGLMKIGELAEKTNETVANIRYWTNEGLLKSSAFTEGGYRLYSPAEVNRVKEIRRLQTVERRTLSEIKDILNPD